MCCVWTSCTTLSRVVPRTALLCFACGKVLLLLFLVCLPYHSFAAGTENSANTEVKRPALVSEARSPSVTSCSIAQASDDGTEVNCTSWCEDGFADCNNHAGRFADNTTCTVGLRFGLPGIDQGDTITFARLRFSSQGGEISSMASLEIRGEDADDSPTFSDSRRPSQLSKTAVSVDWTISEAWVAGVTWGHTPLNYYSPNIAGVLNEIISRPEWGTGPEGKHIVLIIQEGDSAVSESNYIMFDDLPGYPTGHEDPAVLEIYCTPADAFIGREFLGRPTDTSVTVNCIHLLSLDAYAEYGPEPAAPGAYPYSTVPLIDMPAGEPIEIVIGGLEPGTEYYYRIRFRLAGSSTYLAGDERSFRTQCPRGSSFTFTIQSDSHLLQCISKGEFDNLALYDRTISSIPLDQPDFHMSLGDFAFPESYACGHALTRHDAVERYLYQRQRLDRIAHSIPFYLVLGNHEGEQGWRYLDPADSIAHWGAAARLRVIPNPAPDDFYSGDEEVTPCFGLRESYYAWEWGDALFVTLDPFWHTTIQPYSREPEVGSEDAWDWTLGEDQYHWLHSTLQNSSAEWKFVFAHHMTGGVYSGMIQTPYGHGGIEAAKYSVDGLGSYEWGGEDENGVYRFAEERPGWGYGPIHDLMVSGGVDIFFHGHDHVFVRQDLDGVVYQEVPCPGDAEYSNGNYVASKYKYGIAYNSSGYISVTVIPASVEVDYVRSVLPEDEPLLEDGTYVYDRGVSYSYTIAGAGVNKDTDAPGRPRLFANRPNPFRSITNVSFFLPQSDGVSVAVYDLRGRLLRRLCRDGMGPGMHEVIWDGSSSAGHPVAPGVYFCCLTTASGYTETRKMVLLQ